MKNTTSRWLLIGWMVASQLICEHPKRAQAEVKDARKFAAPHAHCMAAQKGRTLTAVGKFPSLEGKDFEIAADTRVTKQPNFKVEFQDPSINIFNQNCELVWRKSYPSLSEVGFETLQLPSKPMLFVSAISIFQPVDQTISQEELLSSTEDSLVTEISFGSDRYDASYLGRFGPTGDYGLVMIFNSTPWLVSMDAISPAITALVYRWHAFDDPGDQAGAASYLMVGPQRVDSKQLAALNFSREAVHPPFPMYKFVFGRDIPG